MSQHSPLGARDFPRSECGRADRRRRGRADRRAGPASRRRRQAARRERRACRPSPPCARAGTHARAPRRPACCDPQCRSRSGQAPPPSGPSPRDARPRAGTRNSSSPPVRRSAASGGSWTVSLLPASGERVSANDRAPRCPSPQPSPASGRGGAYPSPACGRRWTREAGRMREGLHQGRPQVAAIVASTLSRVVRISRLLKRRIVYPCLPSHSSRIMSRLFSACCDPSASTTRR